MTANDNTVPHADQKPRKTRSRLAALRTTFGEWWNDAWDDGGVLHERWEELRQAPDAGWHGMAHWIKALLATAGLSVIALMLQAATGVVLDALHQLLTAAPRVQVGTDTSTGVWAVIDQPVRTYIAQHSAGLAISASTVYTLWQLTGIGTFLAGFATRSNGVRLTWTAWGAASAWMVWTATPGTGRTVATGLAVLTWTLASAFALRGLNLRPRVFANIRTGPTKVQVRPEIHVAVEPHPEPDTRHRSDTDSSENDWI